MNYSDYLKTPWWKSRRARYFATHDAVCAACESDEHIHLHHHTYEHFGAELDGDLLPLCSTCHSLVHRYHRERGGSLTVATFECAALLAGRELATESQPEPTHAPQRLRGATKDAEGRMVAKGEWREETRSPSWIKPFSG